jgi:hypothetical protein
VTPAEHADLIGRMAVAARSAVAEVPDLTDLHRKAADFVVREYLIGAKESCQHWVQSLPALAAELGVSELEALDALTGLAFAGVLIRRRRGGVSWVPGVALADAMEWETIPEDERLAIRAIQAAVGRTVGLDGGEPTPEQLEALMCELEGMAQ